MAKVLEDMQTSLGEQDDQDTAQPTRSITLVSHAPNCEDVCVWMPQGEGRVPQCPFAWDRHRFVDWTMDAGQTYRHFVPGEELPPGDVVLHAQWKRHGPINQTDGLDFSSCRLIVGSEDEPSFGEVLSHHEDVWLLRFDDACDAAWAYVDHKDELELIAPDIAIEAASDEDNHLPLADALAKATNVGNATPRSNSKRPCCRRRCSMPRGGS